MRSRTMSKCSTRSVTRPSAFIVSDGGLEQQSLDADRRRCPAAAAATAGRPPRLLLGAAWTAAIGVGLERRLVGNCQFVRPADRILPQAPRRRLSQGYRRYRQIYRAPRSGIMTLFRAVAWDIDGTLVDSEGFTSAP